MLASIRFASLSTGLLLVASLATAQPQSFVTPLSGGEEVPAVDTRARGLAFLQLDATGSELSFQLNVSRLEGVTQAHIHCGAEGVNGPPVVFLFALMPGGVDVEGVLSSGGLTDGDVIARPDSPECPGGVATLDDVAERMAAGETYVNVHTIAHPGGEIRGQIRPAGRDRR